MKLLFHLGGALGFVASAVLANDATSWAVAKGFAGGALFAITLAERFYRDAGKTTVRS